MLCLGRANSIQHGPSRWRGTTSQCIVHQAEGGALHKPVPQHDLHQGLILNLMLLGMRDVPGLPGLPSRCLTAKANRVGASVITE